MKTIQNDLERVKQLAARAEVFDGQGCRGTIFGHAEDGFRVLDADGLEYEIAFADVDLGADKFLELTPAVCPMPWEALAEDHALDIVLASRQAPDGRSMNYQQVMGMLAAADPDGCGAEGLDVNLQYDGCAPHTLMDVLSSLKGSFLAIMQTSALMAEMQGADDPGWVAKKAAYLSCGGVICPFCGSNNISGGCGNHDAGTYSQQIGCDEPGCGASWYDIYRMVDIEVAEWPHGKRGGDDGSA